MLQIIKFHIGLFRYLKSELFKKRTFVETLKFSGKLVVIYFKELFKLLRTVLLVFNKEYRIKRTEYKKYQQIRVDLQRCLKMLQYIDVKMKRAGVPHWKIKQFWRDFYKNGEVRKDVFDELLKETDQLNKGK